VITQEGGLVGVEKTARSDMALLLEAASGTVVDHPRVVQY
jgi:hypothetical protein